MKVLFLTHQYFPRHVGGTEVYTRGLVRHVVQEGHQALVLTCQELPSPHRQDFHVQRSNYEGLPLVEVHFNLSVTEHPARAEYDNPFPAQAVQAELHRFRPDVVHVLHAMKLSGAAVQACVDAGVPVIVTLCDFWFICPRHTLLHANGQVCTGPDSPRKCVSCIRDLHGFAPLPTDKSSTAAYLADLDAIERRAGFLLQVLVKARRIIALSEFQKKMFVANGYPANRIEVIAHGLDGESVIAAIQNGKEEKPGRLRRLGFLGSLVRHKGAHVLLQALAQVSDLPLECRVHGPVRAGDGYCDELRRLAAKDARVRLCGGFAPEELGRLLRELDLLAVPALWYENDPLIVKAALRQGLPVLASRIGTLEEMVAPRGAEWLVEAGNVTAWADALRRLGDGPLPVFTPAPIKTLADNAREMLDMYHSLTGAQA